MKREPTAAKKKKEKPAIASADTESAAQKTEPKTPFDEESPAGETVVTDSPVSGPLTTIPRPVAFRFDKDSPKHTPAQFLRYWQTIHENPEWRPRLIAYMYRLWPKLAKPETERKYEGVFAAPPNSLTDLLPEYGSGIYRMYLNASGGSRKEAGGPRTAGQLCQCIFQIDDPNYEPVVDPAHVDLADPINQTWIKKQRAKGIRFPNDTETADDGGDDVAAVAELVKVVAEQAKQQHQHKPDSGSGARAVEVVAEAAKQGQDIMAQSMKMAIDGAHRNSDPILAVKPIIDMVTGLMGQRGNDEGMVKLLMEQQAESARRAEEHARTVAQMQAEHHKQQTELLRAMIEKKEAPQPSVSDRIGEILAIRRGMKDLMGGAIEEEERPSNPSFWETEAGAEVIRSGAAVVQSLAAALLGTMIGGGGMGVMAQGMQGMQGTPTIPASGPVPVPGALPDQHQQQQQQEKEAMNVLRMTPAGRLVTAIEEPLIQHLTEGASGHDFASWFLEGYGAYYGEIQKQEPGALATFITQVSDRAKAIAFVNPARFQQFVIEFLQGPTDDEEDEETVAAPAQAPKPV